MKNNNNNYNNDNNNEYSVINQLMKDISNNTFVIHYSEKSQRISAFNGNKKILSIT